MKTIGTLTKENYELKEGTKTVWQLVNTEVEDLTDEKYNNITSKDTLQWFRRLGGSETATRCYTSRGYRVFKLTSKSPCRTLKTVRKFDFN